MKPIEIKKGVWLLPVIDWNIRDFHGYSVYNGTTYNAYLTVGEKITLFDTCKKEFSDELISLIKQTIGESKIDYIVLNHAEPDHSGSLKLICDHFSPEKIFCSQICKTAIIDHYHETDLPFVTFKDGDEVNIGGRTVHFMETKMLHWPDSCFSYLKEDKILISSDAFGHHWATAERFDDEVDYSVLMKHSAKYYANILMPYSPLVRKLLAKVEDMGLDIDVIAPDHGVVWRKYIKDILTSYKNWSEYKLSDKAIVVYDTMWKSTEKMAVNILGGLKAEGLKTELLNLRFNHRSDVMTEILDSSVVVFGSPTLNNGILPKVSDMLCYMRGLKPMGGRIGGAFGSYGWSGEAVTEIKDYMVKAGFEMPLEALKVKYVPAENILNKCFEFGRELAVSALKVTV